MQGLKQPWAFWAPRLGPSLAILDHVKVSGSYSSASWAKLELSQAMLGHVRSYMSDFCWAMWLVLHPKMLSLQQDQNFKWVSAS